MPDTPLDWRTEIATQVCKLVRDDRVMARFRAMCAAFPEEKKRDEERRDAWEQRRKEHCQRGLHSLDDFKARTAETERLGNDREAIERTRPLEDTKKSLVYDYYQDWLDQQDAMRLNDTTCPGMLVAFCAWVPPELSASATPKLTVPSLFARFTGHLHSPPFGTDIEPGIASMAEKYATLAVIHDAHFPERPSIDEVHDYFFVDSFASILEAIGRPGLCDEELRRRERKARQQVVMTLPNSARASLMEWLADVEVDLSKYLESRVTKTNSKIDTPQKESSVVKAEWLTKIAECVHEDTRNPAKMGQYRAMIREWAEDMVKNARPGTEPARDRIRREHPDWSDEQVAKELGKYDFVMEDGTIRRGEDALDVLHDPITITTHAGTPLNKKYATLAAIHDDSDHCAQPIDPWNGKSFNMGALCGPWGDGSPGPESVPPEEYHEAVLAMKYAVLESRVSDLRDDNRHGIEGFLAMVSEDVIRATARVVERVSEAPDEDAPPSGEWSEPLAWAEIGRRVFGKQNERARKIRLLFKDDEVRKVSAKLVRVRLDRLDQLTRKKIEKPHQQ